MKVLSAKGSLKQARDPRFQALFAIRGVSANVFKMTLDQIVGQNGNKEFTDLITVLGCNVGSKFDINKLQYNKIIIASDADVDGYFIRSLLLAFFFKLFPEIIMDERLFIAEPPLYRVDDKKNPFVINKKEYIDRYVKAAMKDYKLGYINNNGIEWLNKQQWSELLGDTRYYADDITETLAPHYKVNDRLLEFILEEFALNGFDPNVPIRKEIDRIDIQHLMNRIGTEFSELYYDDERHLIMGPINTKPQSVEISEPMIRMARPLIGILSKWMPPENGGMVLKNIKTSTEYNMSLLGILKILKKYQPNILHRFKGLELNLSPNFLNCWNTLIV